MSKTLKEIKDDYAKEYGSESFYEFTSFLYDISDDTLDDVAERYAQSKTQELIEQNAELVEMIEHIFYKTNFQNHFPTTSIKVKNLLSKYNHLNQKP